MLDSILKFFISIITAIIFVFYAPTAVVNVNPEKTPEETKSQSVTVMTYNVYIAGAGKSSPENRTSFVTENIRRYMPDSFGLQEADEGWRERIEKTMPEYDYVGVGRNSDGSGEASPVFYNTTKYTLVESGTFWLSKTPDTPSKGWDATYNRVCTYAILKNIETGFAYAHFNAHFDHAGIVSRLEAVSVVAEKIASIAGTLPVVFTGDLNDYEGEKMYSRVLEAGLSDTKHLAENTMSSPTYHGYSSLLEKKEAIDFIFVNEMVKNVKSYTVDTTIYDGIYASDHHPVISEMTLLN